MDYEICRERHRIRRDRAWNETDVEQGLGVYNRTVEEGEFERWFYEDSGFEDDGVHIAVERIPERFRGLVLSALESRRQNLLRMTGARHPQPVRAASPRRRPGPVIRTPTCQSTGSGSS